MNTSDIFRLADECIKRGIFPALAGRRFVLCMDVEGSGRAIIHRKNVDFRLHCPCRVWLMSGKKRYLLGDSFALPGDLSSGTRPPWTG